MTTQAQNFLDRAWAEAETRRAEHLANPHRASVRQQIADKVAANRARTITPGRHKR